MTESKRRLLGILASSLLAGSAQIFPRSATLSFEAQAAPTPSLASAPLLDEGLELQGRLEQLEKQIAALKEQVRRKGKSFHALSQAPLAPQFAWEDGAASEAARQSARQLAKVELKEQLRQLENLEELRERLSYELDWSKLRTSQNAGPAPKHAKASKPFRCAQTPIEGTTELDQDFGPHRDADTGIEWQSSGWWMKKVSGRVHACAAGTVSFVGKVPGRGQVVLIDHGQGHVTLYANLGDDAETSLHRGEKVAAGAALGTPHERLYFEVRSEGHAVNPRAVLSAETLAKLSL